MKKLLLILNLITLTNLYSYQGNRKLGDGNWGTHMTPLVTCVVNTSGPVLEMGAGDYSTPLLHAICSVNKRTMCTLESNYNWLSLFDDLATRWHSMIHVENGKWEAIDLSQTHWSVVFIDHAPVPQRIKDIKRLRNNTDIFVVHDTEQTSYGYHTILPTFKYRYVYTRYQHQTTVVSDTIDVTKFFENEDSEA